MSKSLSPHVVPSCAQCTPLHQSILGMSWRPEHWESRHFPLNLGTWIILMLSKTVNLKRKHPTNPLVHLMGLHTYFYYLMLNRRSWHYEHYEVSKQQGAKATNPIQESITTNQFRASMKTKPTFEVYLHTFQTERENLDMLNVCQLSTSISVSGASLGCITYNVLCLCLGHYMQHIWCLYWLMDITCFSNKPPLFFASDQLPRHVHALKASPLHCLLHSHLPRRFRTWLSQLRPKKPSLQWHPQAT